MSADAGITGRVAPGRRPYLNTGYSLHSCAHLRNHGLAPRRAGSLGEDRGPMRILTYGFLLKRERRDRAYIYDLGTALDELERRDPNTALITLCVGVGMGTATITERI